MLAFIDGVPLLASLGSHERDVLVSAFKRVEFEEGEAIIHEGDTEVRLLYDTYMTAFHNGFISGVATHTQH